MVLPGAGDIGFEEGGRLRNLESPAPPLAQLDGKDHGEIFLTINAIEAMPHGGLLLLEHQPEGLSKDGQQFAVARVSDTGDGIAPEHLAQIFDPFFTTKDVGQGTGLGLAISRRIIEDHGGWIEAANRTDVKGAIFEVFLPQAQNLPDRTYEQAVAGQEA